MLQGFHVLIKNVLASSECMQGALENIGECTNWVSIKTMGVTGS